MKHIDPTQLQVLLAKPALLESDLRHLTPESAAALVAARNSRHLDGRIQRAVDAELAAADSDVIGALNHSVIARAVIRRLARDGVTITREQALAAVTAAVS